MVNILSVDSLLSVVNAYIYQQFLFLCVSLSICQFVCITLCIYVLCIYHLSRWKVIPARTHTYTSENIVGSFYLINSGDIKLGSSVLVLNVQMLNYFINPHYFILLIKTFGLCSLCLGLSFLNSLEKIFQVFSISQSL